MKYNDENESHSPFREIISRWRDDYILKLKEIHKLRFDSRTYKTDADRNVHVFLKMLLETLDSYDSMIDYIQHTLPLEDEKSKRIFKSFKLIRKQFEGSLRQFGAVPMETKIGEFIPGLHEAVGIVESTEIPDGYVFCVEKQGYYWKNKVLRPAEVLIASSKKKNRAN